MRVFKKRLSEGMTRRARKLSGALGEPRAESVMYASENTDAYPGAVRCKFDESHWELLL